MQKMAEWGGVDGHKTKWLKEAYDILWGRKLSGSDQLSQWFSLCLQIISNNNNLSNAF